MTDDENIAEELLILRFLTGFHEDDSGRPVISYLDHDSDEGKRAAPIAITSQPGHAIDSLSISSGATCAKTTVTSRRKDAAIQAAEKRFPLKRSRIAEIWQLYKEQAAE